MNQLIYQKALFTLGYKATKATTEEQKRKGFPKGSFLLLLPMLEGNHEALHRGEIESKRGEKILFLAVRRLMNTLRGTSKMSIKRNI